MKLFVSIDTNILTWFNEFQIKQSVENGELLISILDRFYWEILFANSIKFQADHPTLELELELELDVMGKGVMLYDTLSTLINYDYRVRFTQNDDTSYRIQLDFILT